MAERLAFNLHTVPNGPAILPVFAAYVIPREGWSPDAENAMADKIAAELRAMGCEPKAARVAGGSFMAFGFALGYGLRDLRDGIMSIRAERALDAWVRAKIDAWNAAASKAEAA